MDNEQQSKAIEIAVDLRMNEPGALIALRLLVGSNMRQYNALVEALTESGCLSVRRGQNGWPVFTVTELGKAVAFAGSPWNIYDRTETSERTDSGPHMRVHDVLAQRLAPIVAVGLECSDEEALSAAAVLASEMELWGYTPLKAAKNERDRWHNQDFDFDSWDECDLTDEEFDEEAQKWDRVVLEFERMEEVTTQ